MRFHLVGVRRQAASEIDGDNVVEQHTQPTVVKHPEYSFHLLSLIFLPKASSAQLKFKATAITLTDLILSNQPYFTLGLRGSRVTVC